MQGGVDPVRDRRAHVARLAGAARRAGFGLFGIAMALFLVGLVTGLPSALAMAVIACLVLGSIVLVPSIILGYAVRAAEREDRSRGV